METLAQRRKQQSLIPLYKCLHDRDGPKYIRDFFLALGKLCTI